MMDSNEVSDLQLMERILNGDVVAFETLYDRYGSAVMGVAYKVLNNQAQAEEVVQEAFWNVWRRADSFEPERGSVAGWVMRIARNQAIDSLRRRQARPEPVAFEDAYRYEDTESNVSAHAWMAIQREQVRAAIAELPAEQREVIELAFFHGKTRREIAAECDVPLGTVHTRARLALQKLQQSLQANGLEL